MSNWRLTAKQNVTSPEDHYRGKERGNKKKDLKKGFSFIVAARSTGGPDHNDVIAALLLEGFCKEEAECYDGSSWKNNFDGVEIGELDWARVHDQEKALKNINDYSGEKRETKKEKTTFFSTEKKTEKKSSSSSYSSSNKDSDDNGSCVKFIFTVIPILPIWWLIKLFIKAGAASFLLIWWVIKAIFYIITWPFRIFMCCCLSAEERRLLPEWTFDIMPAYSFKKF